jgi:hypothetical protein
MNVVRLLRRRSRACVGLLILVLLLTTVATAAIAGSIGYLTLTSLDGVRDALHEAEPQDVAVQVHTRMSDDPATQRAAAAALLEEGLGGLPLVVWPSARSTTLTATAADGSALGDVVLGSDDRLLELVRVVEGSWVPDAGTDAGHGATAAALQADAAEALGLGVGDRLSVVDEDEAPVEIEVTALWTPLDPEDPAWFGDPLVADGADNVETPRHGPLIVSPDALADLAGLSLVRWTVVPDADRVEPGDLPAIREAVAAVVEALDDDDTVEHQGLVAEGDLGLTLRRVETSVVSARGVTTSAILVVIVAALVALSQAARLLGTVRTSEMTLLRSRGATPTQLGVAAVVEGTVVAAAGSAAGVVIAGAGLRSVGWFDASLLVWTGAAICMGVATLLGGVTVAQARTIAVRGRSDTTGRRAAAVARWLPPIAVLAAGLASWQMLRYGSPVFLGVDDRMHLDPLALAAVPLALMAVALVGAALLELVAKAAAGRMERSRGLLRSLSLRQLARRAPLHSIPVLLVALTVATCGFASAFAGSWQAYRETLALAENGADVRAVLGVTGSTLSEEAPVAERFRQISGVDEVIPVRVTGFASGSVDGTLVALSAERLDRVTRMPDGRPDRPAVVLGTEGGAPAVQLPAGTTHVGLGVEVAPVDVEAGADVGAVAARVWLADGDDDLVVAEAGTATAEAVGDGRLMCRWDVAVPGSQVTATWRVVAVDLIPESATPVRIGEPEVLAGGVASDDVTWTALVFGADGPLTLGLADSRFVLDQAGVDAMTSTRSGPSGPAPVVRLVPNESSGAALPVVATDEWMAGHGLAEGATTRIRVAGRTITAEIVGSTSVVPGAVDDDVAALADLGATNDALLRSGTEVPVIAEVWLATDEPEAVADSVAAASAVDPALTAQVTTAVPADDPQSVRPVTAFWVAAVAVLVLVVPGLAAAALAIGATRREELAVLRALGVGAAQQGRLRCAELGWVSTGALALGAAGGLLVGWLCAGALVHAGVAAASPVPVHITPDAVGGVGLLVTTGIAVAAVTAGYGVRVRNEARHATGRDVAQ